jgi:hypothetical protein
VSYIRLIVVNYVKGRERKVKERKRKEEEQIG